MRRKTLKSTALSGQIADRIRVEIASGVYKPGDKIPPVRGYSEELGVTTNTLQKAFRILGDEGLIEAKSTSGRFVTSDTSVIDGVRQRMRSEVLTRMCNAARRLGYTKAEVISFVSNYFESREKEK